MYCQHLKTILISGCTYSSEAVCDMEEDVPVLNTTCVCLVCRIRVAVSSTERFVYEDPFTIYQVPVVLVLAAL